MNNTGNIDEELLKRLKLLKIEDIIWTILIGLLILSFYANKIERDFLIHNNQRSREQYRHLQTFIFVVATLTYLFYMVHDYRDLFKLKETDSPKKIDHTYLSFIASLFIFIAGVIYIYIAVTDTEVETEISL